MKEIDFISSLFAMCKTRFANSDAVLQYWPNASLKESIIQVKELLCRTLILSLWFSLLASEWVVSLLLSPCMLLGSSSKVNTLSLELHQPTDSLFLIDSHSGSFASDFLILTEIHFNSRKDFFNGKPRSWPLKHNLVPKTYSQPLMHNSEEQKSSFPYNPKWSGRGLKMKRRKCVACKRKWVTFNLSLIWFEMGD